MSSKRPNCVIDYVTVREQDEFPKGVGLGLWFFILQLIIFQYIRKDHGS